MGLIDQPLLVRFLKDFREFVGIIRAMYQMKRNHHFSNRRFSFRPLISHSRYVDSKNSTLACQMKEKFTVAQSFMTWDLKLSKHAKTQSTCTCLGDHVAQPQVTVDISATWYARARGTKSWHILPSLPLDVRKYRKVFLNRTLTLGYSDIVPWYSAPTSPWYFRKCKTLDGPGTDNLWKYKGCVLPSIVFFKICRCPLWERLLPQRPKTSTFAMPPSRDVLYGYPLRYLLYNSRQGNI